jgi:predicted dehydrogenase
MKELNVAIIGAGLLGETHAKAYTSHKRCNLLWVVDLNLKRAKALAKKYKCNAATDLNKVLKDKRVDAASVVTPDFAHKDITLKLLKAGKHVLCEKPLATNTKDAAAMVKEAKKRKLNLMVDFQNRWSPLFLETKKQIESGALGNLVCGYARLSNTLFVPTKMLAWAGRSGPEWFLLPHIFDLVRWMTGRKKIVEVFARGQKKILKSKGIDAFDSVQTSVKFADGSFFTFENSWVLPEGSPTMIDFKMSFLGSKGKIELNGDNQGIAVTNSKKMATPFILAEQNAFGKTTGFFQEPVLHFVDSLLAGKKPEAPGEDGLAATMAVEAAVISIKKGKPVKVKI